MNRFQEEQSEAYQVTSASSENLVIFNAQIVTLEQAFYGAVLLRNGRIAAIIADLQSNTEDTVLPPYVLQAIAGSKEAITASLLQAGFVTLDSCTFVDGEGGWLLPGFIDVHVHGGNGAEFMEATPAAFNTIAAFHAAHGTTRLLATTVTAGQEDLERVLATTSDYRTTADPMPYAQIEGVHLEGPFISPKWPGAQNPAHIEPPRLDWLESWLSRYPRLIRQVTLAPERDHALPVIEQLREAGIIAACGHTDASYAQIVAAADAGLSQAVHTYNAMTGLHHREPGTLGAVLTDDRIAAELIADGQHVHPAAIELLVRAKPADKLLLITDAMAAAGMPDGEYRLGELPVRVKHGSARLLEGNALAGSTLTMSGAVRFMLTATSLDIVAVSRMASANPARQLGMFDLTGSITPGKIADLVLLDQQLLVKQTWVQGRLLEIACEADRKG